MSVPDSPSPNDDIGAPSSAASTPLDPWRERELRAFVGPKAEYYLAQWGPHLRGEGEVTGFNWAAFFLSGLWIGYRKMYTAAFILFGLILVESVLEDVLFVGVLKMPESPGWMTTLVGIVVAGISGVCGNRWYLLQAERTIAKVRSLELDEEAHLKALEGRGGRSLGVSLGLFFLFLAAIVIVDFFLEPLLGQF